MAQGEKRPVVMEAAKGVPGGVASLGADGKVPQEQLPEFGIPNAEIKQKLVDDDCLAITDSEANNRTKRVFWSNIKEILGGLFVPVTRKINKKALSSDVSLNAADVGARSSDWTPSAADVGAVPTSRTVNGKALSSNVTLTGADINVSGTDATSISTALSNKADGATHKLQTYTAYTDIGLSGTDITLAQILEKLPMNSELSVYNTDSASLSDEYIPSVGKYGVFTARKAAGNLLIVEWHTPLNGNGTRAGDYTGTYRSTSTPPWSGWAPVATATPPQEYDLPLANGLQKIHSVYWKDQFNIVSGYFNVQIPNSGGLSSGTQIAALPEGFRPGHLAYFPGVVSDGTSFGIRISGDGSILTENFDLTDPENEGRYLKAFFSFVSN